MIRAGFLISGGEKATQGVFCLKVLVGAGHFYPDNLQGKSSSWTGMDICTPNRDVTCQRSCRFPMAGQDHNLAL